MNRMPHRIETWRAVIATAGLSVAFAAPQAEAQAQTAAPQSQIINSIAGQSPVPVLEVRKHAKMPERQPHMRYIIHLIDRGPRLPIKRPALAGVLLVEPIPGPFKRQHPIVPMPAYFIDGIASNVTTPPPAVVCERRRRDPSLPDPRLYREVPLVCGYDIE